MPDLRHAQVTVADDFATGAGLLKGQCVDPITGGKGDFAGARGLNMVDRPVGSEVRTTYRGHIVLNAVPDDGDAVTPPARAGGAASRESSAP